VVEFPEEFLVDEGLRLLEFEGGYDEMFVPLLLGNDPLVPGHLDTEVIADAHDALHPMVLLDVEEEGLEVVELVLEVLSEFLLLEHCLIRLLDFLVGEGEDKFGFRSGGVELDLHIEGLESPLHAACLLLLTHGFILQDIID